MTSKNLKKLFLFVLFVSILGSLSAQDSQKALHDEALAFMNMYNETIFKSQDKLTIFKKKGNISKLGTEKTTGDISGTLTYSCKVKGMGGDAKLIYENYSDFPGIVINGESNILAKMNLHGWMYGMTTVTNEKGEFLGTIDYSKLEIIHSVDGGGGYTVTLAGKEPVWIQWDEVERPADRVMEYTD